MRTIGLNLGASCSRVLVLAFFVSLSVAGLAGAATLPGALTQLDGTAGCVKSTLAGGGDDCGTARAILGPRSMAVSPDGKHAYAPSFANVNAVAVFARDKTNGALTQLAGINGCVSEDGTDGATPPGSCVDGKGLLGAFSVAISPDGKHVYVASYVGHSIAAFSRNKMTGALTQLTGKAGCISEDGTGGDCEDGYGLNYVDFVIVSPDGKHVYTASSQGNTLLAFARNAKTGALTQLSGTAGCVRTGDAACTVGRAMDRPQAIAISKDGKHLYVAAQNSNAVAVFARDKKTGALTQPSGADGCISETGTDGATGSCGDGKALIGTFGAAVSPDGKHVYAVSIASNAVAVFTRNAKTGALAQLGGTAGCVSNDGTSGDCVQGKALSGPFSLAISPDGKSVYVAAGFSAAVSAFSRDKKTGVLTQLTDTAGCVSEDGTSGDCTDGKSLDQPYWVVVSKNGKSVYVTTVSGNDAIAVFSRQK